MPPSYLEGHISKQQVKDALYNYNQEAGEYQNQPALLVAEEDERFYLGGDAYKEVQPFTNSADAVYVYFSVGDTHNDDAAILADPLWDESAGYTTLDPLELERVLKKYNWDAPKFRHYLHSVINIQLFGGTNPDPDRGMLMRTELTHTPTDMQALIAFFIRLCKPFVIDRKREEAYIMERGGQYNSFVIMSSDPGSHADYIRKYGPGPDPYQ